MVGGNPYVGARPLLGERVFGRDRERREIVDLLIAERVVLLHSPSGAGKTSLLQARGGVADTLREEGFAVLPSARVGLSPSGSTPANRYVDSLLTSLDRETGAALDDALRSLAARSGDAVGTVLIVDQFEEILTVDPAGERERIAFFQALGRALGDRRVWALFAMRDEHVGPLAPYRTWLPTHLSATYRLDMLAPEAARRAIVCPARHAGVPFTEGAADKLVEELRMVTVPRPDGTVERRSGTSVEPVQLQVVCHRLWLRRDPAAGEITEGDVSGIDSVDAALSDYYASAVAAAARGSGESEHALRDWIGQELVTGAGVRGQVMRYGGRERRVGDEAVRRLVDAYVLRQDTRRGVDWIELAHDRLIDPIVKDNAAWRKEHLNVTQKRAALWEERGRDAEQCLRGPALEEAERWAASHEGQLTPTETEFLAASRKVRDEERTVRLRSWLILAAALAMLAGALGSWALKQKLATERVREAERKILMMTSARDLLAHNHAAVAMKLLLETDPRDRGPEWIGLANEALNEGGLLVTLRGDPGYEPIASFSPDGARVLTASFDGTVRVLNADGSGRPLVLSGHHGHVWYAEFSKDGKKIVSLDEGHTVRVWNADGSGEPTVLSGDYGEALSHDARRIAIGDPDYKTLWLRNTDGSGEAVALRGHQGEIEDVKFTADDKKLVTVSADRTARVWSVEGSGAPLVFTGHTDAVVSLDLSPDGTRFVTGSRDETARVWRTDGSGRSIVLSGNGGAVVGVAFSPDGTKVATASEDATARVWSADGSGAAVVLRGHQSPLTAVSFSSDGKHVVTASEDGTARVWRVDGAGGPVVLRGHHGPVRDASFNLDGTKVVTASTDKTVRVWNARGTGEPVAEIGSTVGSRGAFSPDFERLVHPNGLTYLGACTTQLRRLDGASRPVALERSDYSASFSPDGTKIVTASDDRTARVWRADGSGEPVVLSGHRAAVLAAAFSPDGERVITGSIDGMARVWRADGSGEPVVLAGRGSPVLSVEFSPDGRRVVAGFQDNTTGVWDADGGGAPIFFAGHDGPVLAAAFSADGTQIATGSTDHTVRVWNADGSGEPIVLYGHSRPVDTVAFDSNSRRVVTISEDGELKVWNLSVEALADRLESATADCLLPDQRARYLEEPLAQARERYAACEREHGRMPWPEAP